MKALTIFQPWASLIMAEAKPYEFRSYDYAVRGGHGLAGQHIVIHAAARQVVLKEVEHLMDRIRNHGGAGTALRPDKALPILEPLVASIRGRGPHFALPLASGLGMATLLPARRCTDLFRGTIADSDRINHHMWAWPLQAIEPFRHVIPARGMQGFWNWPKDLEREAAA